MTQAQGACLGLLAEIQKICDDNKIRVYLIGKQLWAAKRNGKILGYEADVAMFYDDFVRFKAFTRKKYGTMREIESYEDNSSLPGVYYRYVDAGSTFFNLEEFYLFRKQGIYVNIHIIRSSGRSQNALSVYEWGMGKGLHRSRRAKVYGDLVICMRHLTGEEKQKKRILTLFENARIEKGGKTEIKLPLGKRMVFPSGFWSGQSNCTLNGYDLTTVKCPDEYLALQYGENWEKKKIRGKKETYMCVCCPKLPYSKYWEHVDKEIVNEVFFSKRKRYLNSYKESIRDYNKQTKHSWDVFYSIDEQFRLQDQIATYKEEVIHTWEKGHHDNAMMIMGDYINKIEEYRKKKIALVADEDLWNLYIEWLMENGRDGTVKNLSEILQKGQMNA